MKRVAIVVLAILILPVITSVGATSGRATNIDLAVGDISITYPDTVNRSKYQMFSSNYPILGFNKPENLYVTDGVLGVDMNINIEINNLGNTQSGFVDVQVYVLHNEYTRFELLNYTTGTSPIPGSSNAAIDVLWKPTYAGNHTLQIKVSNSNGDDVPENNQKNRHLTIAYSYDNCDDMSAWSTTGEWKTNGDIFITSPYAFHVGNGEFSAYSSSTTSTLTTPPLNLADDVSGHRAAIGYSFFYTGGVGSGDRLTGYALDDSGNWDETFNIQTVVDNNFQDGSKNWNTFSIQHKNRNSPLVPLGNEHFHANTQFRFTFTSDGNSEDIGYWFDEFVIIYDQAAKKDEYALDINAINTIGGLPGDWATTRLQIENVGNISAKYTPTAYGIPSNWTYYFANPNGASISSNGLEVLPGETKTFDLRVLVDENASQGNIPVIINMTTNAYPDIQDSVSSNIKILPSRLPDVVIPEFTPRCKPGDSCNFPIEVRNVGEATDVFNITIEEKFVPTSWSVSLAWNQSSKILVRTDNPQHIWLTVTIPDGVEPDVTAEVYVTATSTNDSRKYDTEVIDISAAMNSNAEISHELRDVTLVNAGESVEVSFRIWNNASRIDIFTPVITSTQVPGWNVNLVDTPDIAIAPGSSQTFTVRITAPETAQSNDVGPSISPKAISTRSGDEIIGNAWQGVKVSAYRNLTIELIDRPETLTPGIPISINLRISNYGNGPDTGVLDLPWSPDSWEWWALSDGVNVTEGIPLSATYDLENVKDVSMWIILPPLESPGEVHEITIGVSSSLGEDIYIEDNSIMFEAITEVIKQPRLDGYFGEIVVETDSTHSFNATAWNIGNAVDTNMRAKLVIQTSPPSTCVVGFISSSMGQSQSANEWMSLNLGPTQSTLLTVDIIVGKECSLNTIVSAKLQLEGGADNLGRIISKEISAVLMVGERRSVTLQTNEVPLETIKYDQKHILWLNLTSTSTIAERFDISAEIEDGWGIICDGYPIHLEDAKIELKEGSINEQIHNMRCEILRENGGYNGEVVISIMGEDSRLNYNITQELSWNKKVTSEGLFSNQSGLIGGSLVAIVIIGMVLFILTRKNDDEFQEEFDDEENYDAPMAGPPATAFVDDKPEQTPVTDPAMEEYQRQLEEYNRQMAEYEAWQASQGSQP